MLVGTGEAAEVRAFAGAGAGDEELSPPTAARARRRCRRATGTRLTRRSTTRFCDSFGASRIRQGVDSIGRARDRPAGYEGQRLRSFRVFDSFFSHIREGPCSYREAKDVGYCPARPRRLARRVLPGRWGGEAREKKERIHVDERSQARAATLPAGAGCGRGRRARRRRRVPVGATRRGAGESHPVRGPPAGARGDQARGMLHRPVPLFNVTMQPITQQLHSALAPTPLWGYNGLYPGPTFETRRGAPINVKWLNNLPSTHMFPIDNTLHGDEPGQPLRPDGCPPARRQGAAGERRVSGGVVHQRLRAGRAVLPQSRPISTSTTSKPPSSGTTTMGSAPRD